MNQFVGKKVLFLDIHNNEREGIIVGYSRLSDEWHCACYMVVPLIENYKSDSGQTRDLVGGSNVIQYIPNVKEYVGKQYLLLKFSKLLEFWDK